MIITKLDLGFNIISGERRRIPFPASYSDPPPIKPASGLLGFKSVSPTLARLSGPHLADVTLISGKSRDAAGPHRSSGKGFITVQCQHNHNPMSTPTTITSLNIERKIPVSSI